MKLPHFIAIAGVGCALFSIGIPNLSAMRAWLWVSTLLSVVYMCATFILSLKDGICLFSLMADDCRNMEAIQNSFDLFFKSLRKTCYTAIHQSACKFGYFPDALKSRNNY